MEFPPKELNDGEIVMQIRQNVRSLSKGVFLQIKVSKGNGYNWVWQVPEVFRSFDEALHYAGRWIHIFRFRKTLF